MKTCIKYLILTALSIGLTAGRAHAGDEALAAFGGFVAGMITGAVIEHNEGHNAGVRISVGDRGRHDDWGRYSHDRRHDRYDRHARCGKHNRSDCRSCYSGRRDGHWEVKQVRIWIPGRWDVEINHCGDRVRVWRAGYFDYRPQRVWVAYNDRGGRHCG